MSETARERWARECPLYGNGMRCNFEPRYDEQLPNSVELAITLGADANHVGALKMKVYVRDICTACGRTIERQKP